MGDNHKENKVNLKWCNVLEEEQRGEEEGWWGEGESQNSKYICHPLEH